MGAGLAAGHAPSQSESIGRSVAEAWQKAWNAHDMEALADVVDEHVDFLTVGGRWLKGLAAFREHHASLHGAVAKESTVHIMGTHAQALSRDALLVQVDHSAKGDGLADGTARPPHHRYFVWVLTQSDGRWRVRASTNTEIVIPPAPR